MPSTSRGVVYKRRCVTMAGVDYNASAQFSSTLQQQQHHAAAEGSHGAKKQRRLLAVSGRRETHSSRDDGQPQSEDNASELVHVATPMTEPSGSSGSPAGQQNSAMVLTIENLLTQNVTRESGGQTQFGFTL